MYSDGVRLRTTRLLLAQTVTLSPTPTIREAAPRVSRRASLAWLLVVPLLLLVAWLGMRGLNADALWYDEWLSVYYAGGGQYGPIIPAETWARVAERSTWPPGFQTLLGGWGALVGWEHLATRMMPLLAGVLAVAWMYRVGRDMVSPRVGFGTAVFLGASAFFANYLHELRGYTMYALFSAMCVWGYWRILRGRGGVWTQITFFVSIVGLLYTHYFATLTAVAVAVYHLLFVPKDRRWWRVPILMALAGLTFLPWLGIAYEHAADALENERRIIVPLNAGKILETLAYSFSNGSVALFALLGVYSFAFRDTPYRRRVLIMAWLWLLIVLAIPVLVNERMRVIFHVRHLMSVWPPLALICALGLEALARRGLRPALVLALWVGAGVWSAFDPAFIGEQPGQERLLNWDEFSQVLNEVEQLADEDDAFLLHVEAPGREWLTEPTIDFYARNLPIGGRQLEQIPGLLENDDYYAHLFEYINRGRLVWFVNMPDVPAGFQLGEFERMMAQDYAACGRVFEGETMTLALYAWRPRDMEASYFQFADGDIGLRTLAPLPKRVDSEFRALVGWYVSEDVPPDTYSYGLHVTDEAGNVVAQYDAGLPASRFTCVYASIDVSHLPPGEYHLNALVYDWQTGERVRGKITDGASGDVLEMDSFVVE